EQGTNFVFRTLRQSFVALFPYMAGIAPDPTTGGVIECLPEDAQLLDVISEFPAAREELLEAGPAIFQWVAATNQDFCPGQHRANGTNRLPVVEHFVCKTRMLATKTCRQFEIA